MIVCLILPISSNKNFEFFFKKITSIGQKIKFESQYRHNKAFSRHIEVFLYNAKLNQTSRKPIKSPPKAVKSSFHSHQHCPQFLQTALVTVKTTFERQLVVVIFWVFHQFDLLGTEK